MEGGVAADAGAATSTGAPAPASAATRATSNVSQGATRPAWDRWLAVVEPVVVDMASPCGRAAPSAAWSR